MSDQIAILNHGRLEQLGTPADIYFRPRTRFTAEFMGSSNTLEMDVTGFNEASSLVECSIGGERIFLKGDRPAGGRITVSVRPEWIKVDGNVAPGSVNRFQGVVAAFTFLGSLIQYRVSCFGGQSLTIHARGAGEILRSEGETLTFGFDPELPVIVEP